MFASILNYPDSVFSQFDRLRRELDEVFTDSRVPSSIRSVAYGSAPPLNVGRTPRRRGGRRRGGRSRTQSARRRIRWVERRG